MTDAAVKEHVEQFAGLLESGEYRQPVMEDDCRDGAWKLWHESPEAYVAQINKPENYAYLANRYRKR